MSAEDVPVRVFEGEYSEVLFLKTLIESAGLETSLGNTGIRGGPPRLIFVRRRDVAQALELVNDFRKNGKRTESW